MRIWCQLPMQFDASDPKVKMFFDLIEAEFRLVKREDTKIKASESAIDLHQSGITVTSRERLYHTPDQNEIEKAVRFFNY